MARLYIARKKQHGSTEGKVRGEGGYFVQSTEPQYSGESKTIEVVAEETGVSPDTVRTLTPILIRD